MVIKYLAVLDIIQKTKKCPEGVISYSNEKFPKKILMWIAIYNQDMSKPLFQTIRCVIKQWSYKFKYLYQRPLKFMNSTFYQKISHILQLSILDWFGRESLFYSIATVDGNLNLVNKESNPPNVPQARIMYKTYWEAFRLNLV